MLLVLKSQHFLVLVHSFQEIENSENSDRAWRDRTGIVLFQGEELVRDHWFAIFDTGKKKGFPNGQFLLNAMKFDILGCYSDNNTLCHIKLKFCTSLM